MHKTAQKLAVLARHENFFPPSIWEGMRKTRERVGLLSHKWTGLDLHNDGPINIYDCYPYLFLNAFPHISSSDVSDLSLAIKLLACSVFESDKIMDRSAQGGVATNILTHMFALQVEAYTLLQRLFIPTSPFWQRFRSYFDCYLHACQTEKQFALGKLSWKSFDEQVALDIATGKASLSLVAVTGLTTLQGDDGHTLKTLIEAVNIYNFAYQMFDDLYSWKEDYLKHSPSLLLCRWLPELLAEPKSTDLDHLARELYYGGHACSILQIAIDAAERAVVLTSMLPNLTWQVIPRNLLECCESLCRDIVHLTQTNHRRLEKRVNFYLELPPAHTPCQRLAWLSLQFLVQQWQRGFSGVRDIAYFPHVCGFTGQSEFQYSDIFQRAFIADSLCDAARVFQLDLSVIIDHEIRYLLERRRFDSTGGWCYYPDLPEMPPDADTLGQMMQLLFHSGHFSGIMELCEQPLSTLLTYNRHADGSFETWILPQQRTPSQARQWHYAQTFWGTDANVDVMANLLYALALYDEDRFGEVIYSGCTYIETQQKPDGSWLSSWFHGPQYGTFACIRLLAKVRPTSSSLEHAYTFLKESQLPDGSWSSVTMDGDLLGTALALLSWFELAQQEIYQPDLLCIQRALHFLQQSYHKGENGWTCNEPLSSAEKRFSDSPTKIVSHHSHGLTITFILKAVTAWQHFQEQLETLTWLNPSKVA